MVTDPEPDEIVVAPNGNGAMLKTYAGGPETPDALEVKRRMMRITTKQFEILVGQPPGLGVKPIVQRPE